MKKLNKKQIVLIVITLIISTAIIAFPFIFNAVKRNQANKVEVTVNTETSKPNVIGEPPGTVVGVDTSYLGGTWQINSSPELPSSRILFDNTQGYGTVSCEAFGDLIEISFNVAAITYYQNAGGEISGLQVYTGSSWQNDGYRTISFSSGSVKQDVLSWLQLNATKTADAQTPEEPSTETSLEGTWVFNTDVTPSITSSIGGSYNPTLSIGSYGGTPIYGPYISSDDNGGFFILRAGDAGSIRVIYNGAWQSNIQPLILNSNADSFSWSSDWLSFMNTIATKQTTPTTPTQLDTPVLTWSNNYLSWTTSANASSYTLYKDGEIYAEDIIGESYIPTVNGSYQVMAVGDGTDYSNSELSTAVTVTITEPTTPTQLTTPTLTNEGSVLSWNAIENATGYQLYKDGSSYQAQLPATTTTYTATESGSYEVMAIGDGTNYSNSELSAAVTVTIAPDPGEGDYDDGYNAGYEDGYNQGHEEGYDEGFTDGKEEGTGQGYEDGYNDALNDALNGIKGQLVGGTSIEWYNNSMPEAEYDAATDTLTLGPTSNDQQFSVLKLTIPYYEGDGFIISWESFTQASSTEIPEEIAFSYVYTTGLAPFVRINTGMEEKFVTFIAPSMAFTNSETQQTILVATPGNDVNVQIKGLKIWKMNSSSQAWQNGYDQGYASGSANGDELYNNGYDAGYEAGLHEGNESSSFKDFITGVFGSLLNFFMQVGNGITIWDISLWQIAISFIAVVVIVKVVKELV